MDIQKKRDLLMSLPLMEQEQRWIMERLDTLSVKEQYQLSAAILRTGKLEELAGKTGWELQTAILHMDPEVAVDAVNCLLSLEDYYRTDLHWRQEQLTDVAARLLEGMGAEAPGTFREETLPTPYYGVYYGYAALPMEPDRLTYLTSDLLDACTVYNYETGKTGPIYDLAKGAGKDPYELFLSGSVSLLTIENPNADTDRELVIFRDSFGSSLAPLLVPGYAKVTLADIRYLPSSQMGKYLTFTDQDVLFLYSAPVLNNSETLK